MNIKYKREKPAKLPVKSFEITTSSFASLLFADNDDGLFKVSVGGPYYAVKDIREMGEALLKAADEIEESNS